MPVALGNWLAALGAGDFVEAFEREGFTSVTEVVDAGLTELDLRHDIGIQKLSVRKRVFNALQTLNTPVVMAAPAAPSLQMAAPLSARRKAGHQPQPDQRKVRDSSRWSTSGACPDPAAVALAPWGRAR